MENEPHFRDVHNELFHLIPNSRKYISTTYMTTYQCHLQILNTGSHLKCSEIVVIYSYYSINKLWGELLLILLFLLFSIVRSSTTADYLVFCESTVKKN